jgi:ABC-type bacteriocin/lantibiotic exporter with double-glycine peptidase domain
MPSIARMMFVVKPDTVKSLSTFATLRLLYHHLTRRRKLQVGALLVLMLTGAIGEVATLGAVIPFLALLANVSQAIRPSYLKWPLTLLDASDREAMLSYVTLIFVSITVAVALVRTAISWVSLRLVYGFSSEFGTEIFRRTLHQPYKVQVLTNTSTTIAGLIKVRNIIQPVIVVLRGLIALILGIAIVAFLILVNAMIASTTLIVFALIYVGLTSFTRRRLGLNSTVISEYEALRTQTIQESLGGIRDVILDGSQNVYVSRFRKLDYAQHRASAQNGFISESPRYLVEALAIVTLVALALLFSRRGGGLPAALPLLGALALGAQRLLPHLQQVYSAWASANAARAVLGDVLALLEQPVPADTSPVSSPSRLHLTSQIRMHNVGFRYLSQGPNVLENVSLVIPRGSRIGLIGKTGAGKSTLIDIIMGLLEPSSGSVTVDGEVIGDHNRRAWQRCIAHVPQAIYLADSSIAENIAFGIEPKEMDFVRVQTAAQKAQVAEFVEKLPNGYQTYIGERGIRLSGGERQRIGLARALYKQANLLILDEATAALDSATEKAVMDTIDTLGNDVTVLVIAHRFTSLSRCSDVLEVIGAGVRWRAGGKHASHENSEF